MNDNPCDYCKQIGYFPDWCDLYQKWCEQKLESEQKLARLEDKKCV